MIDGRIRGKSHKQLAEEFGVSELTVARTLSWAKKAELVVEAEDKILRDLVPAAHRAIESVLAGVNDEVKAKTALEIFKATIPSFGKAKNPTGASSAGTESDLSSYVSKLRDTAALADSTVDGDILPNALPGGPEERAQLALAPAAEADSAPGVSTPAALDESTADASGNASTREPHSKDVDSLSE